MPMQKIDIAIVGGGVSGVYSAWKLKQKYPEKNIVVYEGSDHIGGRLLSVVPPGIPDMVAELGGMRILENTQFLIRDLIVEINSHLKEERKIKLYDFPVNDPQNIAYLRGVHMRLMDFVNKPEKVPYRLSFLEISNINNIIVDAVEKIVPGITDTSLTYEQRLEKTSKAVYRDRPLYKWGFWNVLYDVISSEAYQFCEDSGGYDSIMVNWNAADAIPWFLADFGITPQYKGFTNGFQQVPIELANFFQSLGGEIRLNTKLTAFSWKNDHFELTLGDEKVSAHHLVLAMPRRSLEMLAPHCPLLSSVDYLIKSVTPRPLFKLFTTYDSPWWRASGYTDAAGKYVPLQQGRTVTDLPVRQTYYWPRKNGAPAVKGPSMLLASYDDGSNIGFWDGLRPKRSIAWHEGRASATPEDAFQNTELSHPETADPVLNQHWEDYKAPRRMVAEISRQLREIHDLEATPEVKNAAFRDWGEDPFGGGWNSWNIGVKSAEVRDKIVHPIEEVPLYICGEAYSDAQGWVEGALQTAEIMLKKFN